MPYFIYETQESGFLKYFSFKSFDFIEGYVIFTEETGIIHQVILKGPETIGDLCGEVFIGL